VVGGSAGAFEAEPAEEEEDAEAAWLYDIFISCRFVVLVKKKYKRLKCDL